MAENVMNENKISVTLGENKYKQNRELGIELNNKTNESVLFFLFSRLL